MMTQHGRVSILVGDSRETLKSIPDNSIHCIITSPPYYRLRDYGFDYQIGLEKTPEEFIENLVLVFRECRRILRADGVLWVNMGDSYAGSWKGAGDQNKTGRKKGRFVFDSGTTRTAENVEPKNLLGIPWRLAFALQADGWNLRQDIIWHKPNPMPESVHDRCTKAHEYIFLMTKSSRYYYDGVAIMEQATGRTPGNTKPTKNGRNYQAGSDAQRTAANLHHIDAHATRNKRSVWTVPTYAYPEAHFATYPPELITPCVLAGTSEAGCCSECGAPRVRITERVSTGRRQKTASGWDVGSGGHGSYHKDGRESHPKDNPVSAIRTVGWRPSCDCDAAAVPCTVLDPFAGSGTTGEVALRAGRRVVLCESEKYTPLIEKRLMPILVQGNIFHE